ncbi:MAG: ATP-binding protein [Thermoleophilaceae bacterium]
MPYHRCPACGSRSYSAAARPSVGTCPSCSAPLSDGSRFGTTRRVTRTLPARPEGVTSARRGLAELGFPEPTRETLALLVSELVTNAVIHAGLSDEDSVTLSVTQRPGRARVSVHDAGEGFEPPPPRRQNRFTTGGRGLFIVDSLSDSWGVEQDDEGCTVWCEIGVEEEAGAATERRVTGTYLRELATELR